MSSADRTQLGCQMRCGIGALAPLRSISATLHAAFGCAAAAFAAQPPETAAGGTSCVLLLCRLRLGTAAATRRRFVLRAAMPARVYCASLCGACIADPRSRTQPRRRFGSPASRSGTYLWCDRHNHIQQCCLRYFISWSDSTSAARLKVIDHRAPLLTGCRRCAVLRGSRSPLGSRPKPLGSANTFSSSCPFSCGTTK